MALIEHRSGGVAVNRIRSQVLWEGIATQVRTFLHHIYYRRHVASPAARVRIWWNRSTISHARPGRDPVEDVIGGFLCYPCAIDVVQISLLSL